MPYDFTVGLYDGVTSLGEYLINDPDKALNNMITFSKVFSPPPNNMEEKLLFYSLIATFSTKFLEEFKNKSPKEKGEFAGALASEILLMCVGAGEAKAATKGLSYLKETKTLDEIMNACFKNDKYDMKLLKEMLTMHGDESTANILKLLKSHPEEVFSNVRSIVKKGDFYTLVDESGKEFTLCRSQIIQDLINDGKSVEEANSIVFSLENACFSADTLVITKDGHKRIDEIQIGDFVLSKDVESGANEYKEVLEVYKKNTLKWVNISLGNDIIKATKSHLFFTDSGWWKPAREIKSRTLILDSEGKYVRVENVSIDELEEPESTYNLNVVDFHTYYVGADGLLVHNSCKLTAFKNINNVKDICGSSLSNKILETAESYNVRGTIIDLYD